VFVKSFITISFGVAAPIAYVLFDAFYIIFIQFSDIGGYNIICCIYDVSIIFFVIFVIISL